MKLPVLFASFSRLLVWRKRRLRRPRRDTPDTVIAEYDNGKKLTYGELENFLGVLPKQQREGVMRDRKQFVENTC